MRPSVPYNSGLGKAMVIPVIYAINLHQNRAVATIRSFARGAAAHDPCTYFDGLAI